MVKVSEVTVFAAAALVALASTGCFRAERSCSTDDECLVGEECTVEQFCVRVRLTPDEDASSGDDAGGEPDTGAPDDVGGPGPGDGGEDAPQGCPPSSERCNDICCVSTIPGGTLACAPGVSSCAYTCSQGFVPCNGDTECCPEATVGVPSDIVLSSNLVNGFNGNAVEIAVAPDGETHVFFSYASAESDQTLTGLRHRMYGADGWTDVEFVDAVLGAGRNVSAAVGADGTVHVTWIREFSEDDMDGTYYAYKPPGQAWSAPLSLVTSPSNTGGGLVVDAQGDVHAVTSVSVPGPGLSEFQTRYVLLREGREVFSRFLGLKHDNSVTPPAIALDGAGVPHVLYAEGQVFVFGRVVNQDTFEELDRGSIGGVSDLRSGLEMIFDGGAFAVVVYAGGCVYGGTFFPTRSVVAHPSCAMGADVNSPSVARRGSGFLVSTYHDLREQGLYTARLDGSVWSDVVLQRAGEQVGTVSAVAVGPGGEYYVAYSDSSDGGTSIGFFTFVP
jgi:hypothetical protein